jgi:protein disulfide-isomerase
MRSILTSCLVLGGGVAGAVQWETDYEAGLEKAKQENRFVMINFSGSDWCGWCIRLDREVFSKRDFETYADERLVCVLVDSPRKRELPNDLRSQNEALNREYGVRGFPTVILLNPDGRVVAKTGYQDGGAEAYVDHLKTLIRPHEEDYPLLSPSPSSEGTGLRTWTSRSGATIEAALVERAGGWVTLRQENGDKVRIDERLLSQGDQSYLVRPAR